MSRAYQAMLFFGALAKAGSKAELRLTNLLWEHLGRDNGAWEGYTAPLNDRLSIQRINGDGEGRERYALRCKRRTIINTPFDGAVVNIGSGIVIPRADVFWGWAIPFGFDVDDFEDAGLLLSVEVMR